MGRHIPQRRPFHNWTEERRKEGRAWLQSIATTYHAEEGMPPSWHKYLEGRMDRGDDLDGMLQEIDDQKRAIPKDFGRQQFGRRSARIGRGRLELAAQWDKLGRFIKGEGEGAD